MTVTILSTRNTKKDTNPYLTVVNNTSSIYIIGRQFSNSELNTTTWYLSLI